MRESPIQRRCFWSCVLTRRAHHCNSTCRPVLTTYPQLAGTLAPSCMLTDTSVAALRPGAGWHVTKRPLHQSSAYGLAVACAGHWLAGATSAAPAVLGLSLPSVRYVGPLRRCVTARQHLLLHEVRMWPELGLDHHLCETVCPFRNVHRMLGVNVPQGHCLLTDCWWRQALVDVCRKLLRC